MSKVLDLMDIQGNVIRAYGRYNFPFARYVFFNIRDGARGREFEQLECGAGRVGNVASLLDRRAGFDDVLSAQLVQRAVAGDRRHPCDRRGPGRIEVGGADC